MNILLDVCSGIGGFEGGCRRALDPRDVAWGQRYILIRNSDEEGAGEAGGGRRGRMEMRKEVGLQLYEFI